MSTLENDGSAVTKSEASAKLCPIRTKDFAHCNGLTCMMWRWNTKQVEDAVKQYDDARTGYCGLVTSFTI